MTIAATIPPMAPPERPLLLVAPTLLVSLLADGAAAAAKLGLVEGELCVGVGEGAAGVGVAGGGEGVGLGLLELLLEEDVLELELDGVVLGVVGGGGAAGVLVGVVGGEDLMGTAIVTTSVSRIVVCSILNVSVNVTSVIV